MIGINEFLEENKVIVENEELSAMVYLHYVQWLARKLNETEEPQEVSATQLRTDFETIYNSMPRNKQSPETGAKRFMASELNWQDLIVFDTVMTTLNKKNKIILAAATVLYFLSAISYILSEFPPDDYSLDKQQIKDVATLSLLALAVSLILLSSRHTFKHHTYPDEATTGHTAYREIALNPYSSTGFSYEENDEIKPTLINTSLELFNLKRKAVESAQKTIVSETYLDRNPAIGAIYESTALARFSRVYSDYEAYKQLEPSQLLRRDMGKDQMINLEEHVSLLHKRLRMG